ncbi:serine/threonine-protein kinase [Bdellovibrio svalbardensis]|uniref:Serine/threonine protein kinase n=1 Tax=Bdellovibrio svalbardensis TaxID=2972972 RepID=A0ABT6DHV6_9BACT|nr:serine/threonine-protein kinase [Bdellovibrio svalbardensis]MDG0816443.1 serine/threonine protein kinase [Bdellovibrio svalbardensis]
MFSELLILIDNGEEIRTLQDPISRSTNTLAWFRKLETFVNSIEDSGLQYEAKRLLADEILVSSVSVSDKTKLTKVLQSLKQIQMYAEESRNREIMKTENKIPSPIKTPGKGSVLSTTFDEYTLDKVIGNGGSGTVFSAQSSDGQKVAVKVLKPNQSTIKSKRFKNEIGFCQKNLHPGIIQILDHGVHTTDGIKSLFYVMPLYPKTFREYMKTLRGTEGFRFITQMLDAVEAAHLTGCFHRDLKPENILVDRIQQKLVVTDFGIAHFEEQDLLTAVETQQQDRLANFQYAAPEQRYKGGIVDHRADIYALGLITNEIFTGEVPHGTGFKSIGGIVPELKYLDKIVEKMIHQDPNFRYQNISLIKQEIEALGKASLIQQKLNVLSKEVVAESDVSDDPLIANPIKIVTIDHNGRSLVCTLNQTPSNLWERLFGQGSYSYVLNHPPQAAAFRANICNFPCEITQVERILPDLKRYIESTNGIYKAHIESLRKQEIANQKAANAREIEFQKQRMEMLSKIKL